MVLAGDTPTRGAKARELECAPQRLVLPVVGFGRVGGHRRGDGHRELELLLLAPLGLLALLLLGARALCRLGAHHLREVLRKARPSLVCGWCALRRRLVPLRLLRLCWREISRPAATRKGLRPTTARGPVGSGTGRTEANEGS